MSLRSSLLMVCTAATLATAGLANTAHSENAASRLKNTAAAKLKKTGRRLGVRGTYPFRSVPQDKTIPDTGRQRVVGVMGGVDSPKVERTTLELGEMLANEGWAVLTGGRDRDVQRWALQGAKRAGGVTIGIHPNDDKSEVNEFADIAIATKAGETRNMFNVLSSDVVIAMPGFAGTLNEVTGALKSKQRVIVVGSFDWRHTKLFKEAEANGDVYFVRTPKQAVALSRRLLGDAGKIAQASKRAVGSPRTPVVGVMGGGAASAQERELAYSVGRMIGEQGWTLLNGAGAGAMEESAKGAKQAGGQTVGIVPGKSRTAANRYIDYAVTTGTGDARNLYNVLSSDVVIALPGAAGTISEIALALKNDKHVILIGHDALRPALLAKYKNRVHFVDSPSAAKAIAFELTKARPDGTLNADNPRFVIPTSVYVRAAGK